MEKKMEELYQQSVFQEQAALQTCGEQIKMAQQMAAIQHNASRLKLSNDQLQQDKAVLALHLSLPLHQCPLRHLTCSAIKSEHGCRIPRVATAAPIFAPDGVMSHDNILELRELPRVAPAPLRTVPTARLVRHAAPLTRTVAAATPRNILNSAPSRGTCSCRGSRITDSSSMLSSRGPLVPQGRPHVLASQPRALPW